MKALITSLLLLMVAGPALSQDDAGTTRLSLLTGTAVSYRPCGERSYCIQPIGAMVMGAVNAIDYEGFSFYGSGGASIKSGDSVHGATAVGVQYDDFFKINVFGGFEFGYSLDDYKTPYPYFVGAALQIGGFDLDLTNILSGETGESLMEK